MDALALLCNLYGDGPATLRRLREAGHGELGDLEQISIDELAVILGSSPVAARRFQHEAALLAARARDDGEHEPARFTERASTAIAAPRAAHRDATMERALAAWRAADAAAVAASGDGVNGESAESSTRADEESVPAGGGLDRRESPDRRDSPERRESPERRDSDEPLGAQTTPLRPALVDGLDAETCTRLRAAGVEFAEELLTADLLELSAACELPLTRLMRIQSHVKRLVVAESPGWLVPHPRPGDARFSPDPTASLAVDLRDRRRTDGESGSGPFA